MRSKFIKLCQIRERRIEDGEPENKEFMRSSGASYLAADKLPESSEEKAIREAEERRQDLLQKMIDIEKRTVDSSKRSLGLLLESEKIGVETAQDMSHQREQLENTDRRLDEINTNLKDTQQNINGIKSVFSSLKQWWRAPKGDAKEKKAADETLVSKGEVRITDNLSSAVDRTQCAISQSHQSHPTNRLLGVDDQDDSTPQSLREFRDHSKKVDKQLDEDLDAMSAGLHRLKGLAGGLNQEIEDQNVLLDKIQVKADRADITVVSQNKQMNRILKR